MRLGTWTHNGSDNEAKPQTVKVRPQKGDIHRALPVHRFPLQVAHSPGRRPRASHSLEQGGLEGRVGFLRREQEERPS